VLDIGHVTDNIPRTTPTGVEMLAELGLMTTTKGFGRRRAINALARKYQRQPNEVYEAIEGAKKLVK
jgi:hypothetical protein